MTAGIIGFGRFGPVLARLLLPEYNVVVYDQSDIAEKADRLGIRVVEWDELLTCTAIFISVPIRNFKDVVARLAPDLQAGTTVFDVCSVKVYPATVMQEHFSGDINIIASHPLFGPDSGQHGFANLPMTVHPVSPRNEVFDEWVAYFEGQGLRVIDMSPEEHDKLAADSQGITHFIGRVLKDMGIAATPIDTEGFRDLQLAVEQTCHDSIELFQDLENYNPYTLDMIDRLMKSVQTVRDSFQRRN